MQITYTENDLNVEEYEMLRARVGWKPFTRRQSCAALQNSMYVLCARDETGRPIGMGRIVGDGATVCYVQDLIVVPQCRRLHIGTGLMQRLEAYVHTLVTDGETMRLCLMCALGRESFYESCGFTARPTPELGPGMIRWLQGEKN